MFDMIVPAVAFLACVTAMFGFPSVAIVVIRYFKLKERELTVEMEYRDKAHQQQLALEERLRRIEDALSTDPEMRARLGVEQSATPLPSRGA